MDPPEQSRSVESAPAAPAASAASIAAGFKAGPETGPETVEADYDSDQFASFRVWRRRFDAFDAEAVRGNGFSTVPSVQSGAERWIPAGGSEDDPGTPGVFVRERGQTADDSGPSSNLEGHARAGSAGSSRPFRRRARPGQRILNSAIPAFEENA